MKRSAFSKYTFQPSRQRNGEQQKSRIWWGAYRLPWMAKEERVSLATTDKRVAKQKLDVIVQRLEHEHAGIAMPKPLLEAAQRPLVDHLADYIADLRVRGRAKQYYVRVEARAKRLIASCGWELPKDVSADAFLTWRAKHRKAPKTQNHYLDAMRGLLGWMVENGRLLANALEKVRKVDVRGRQAEKRAFKVDELRRLLAVSGPRRTVYLTAAMTGLRHGELSKLRWGDVDLDAHPPILKARAATSKNRRDAVIDLNVELADELRRLRSVPCNGSAKVFAGGMPSHHTFNADLERADIAKTDDLGRIVCFHSLRYTFATLLQSSGVHPRTTQKLMRHSDPKLTANLYTDAHGLPTAAAVASLPRLLDDAATDADDAAIDAVESADVRVACGRDVSRDGTEAGGTDTQKTLQNKAKRRTKARRVTVCHELSEKWSRGDSNPRAGAVSRSPLRA